MKFKNILKLPLILGVSSVLSLNSCTRTSEKTEYFGPKLIAAKENFALIDDTVYSLSTIAGKPISFNKNIFPIFEANFNSEVSWKLVIQSKINGAKRVLSGTSSKLDATNTLWAGQSDSLLFSKNDTLTATLSVLGLDKKWVTNLFIDRFAPTYTKTGNSTNKGTFADFEGANLLSVSYGDSKDLNGGYFKSDPENSPSANGNFSLKVNAYDGNSDGFCGGFEMSHPMKCFGKVTSSDANDVYLNAYVLGFGKQNSGVKFYLYELDTIDFNNPNDVVNANKMRDETPVPSNVSHSKMIKNFDRWEYQLNPNWTGWKLVSIKYSDFKKPTTDGCNGNCILEPNKIREFSMEINSYPNTSSEVEFAIDYIVLSQGGKFDPSK